MDKLLSNPALNIRDERKKEPVVCTLQILYVSERDRERRDLCRVILITVPHQNLHFTPRRD
jgi:hypothetical protein